MTKKTEYDVRNCVFSLPDEEIAERMSFGRFEVIKSKRGMMYKNYTGYHVWTTPYAVGVDGTAHEGSLYMWLSNLMDFATKCEGRKNEVYDMSEKSSDMSEGEESPVAYTYGDMLDSMVIMTEAVMTHPMTAFTDLDKCQEFSTEYIKWLGEQQELLAKTMSSDAPEEDLKKEFEEGERAKIMDTAAGLLSGEAGERAGADK